MAGAGLIGFYIQQLSLATGRLVASVASVSVVNPVISVLLGALVLQERLDKTPPWHAVVAVGGARRRAVRCEPDRVGFRAGYRDRGRTGARAGLGPR